jgi:hypothetical protein
MKTTLKIMAISALSILMLSCDNDLDEHLYSSISSSSYIYKTSDLAGVVAAPYSCLRNFPTHGGYFCAQECSGDEIVMPANASGWDDGGIYKRMHLHTWTSEQSQISNMWNFMYQGVLFCNDAIDKINAGMVPVENDTHKTSALAELRALRAFYYWLLCDNFGDVPLVTSSSDKDMPAKKSRTEVYNFIVSELQAAIPNLSEDQGGNQYGRMNKWAAKALLANVYLNAEVYTGTAHWNECLSQCNDIINSGKFALENNYENCFKSEGVENSKEIIFTIPFDPIYGGGNFIHMFSWHGQFKKEFLLTDTPWGCGSAMGVTQFIDTYDPDDQRLTDTWIMGPQYESDGVTPLLGTYDKMGQPLNFTKDLPNGLYTSESEGYRMKKYEVVKGCTNNSTTDIPVFRYAEILLMKAECLLRTGISGAGELVTQVRQRDFKSNPSKAIVTDDELKQNSCYQYGYVDNYKIVDKGNTDPIQFGRLLDEYGWEFAWEMHRRRDMIRFGIYTKKSWLSHIPKGDYRTVFPIPETVLTSNPKLEQNPNYVNN